MNGRNGRVLTHLSLFSGIGGLDLAGEMAGFQTVGQCEYADFQTKVLRKHWPDVPRWREIQSLTGESFHARTGLRTVDVVSGGFPCQPFSLSGKRKGKADDRYLWPEMLRVIQEIWPAWVIGENVPGIINMALDTVLFDLEDAGYECQAFVVPACGVDAPHKRDRVCVLAHTIDGGSAMRRHRELQNLESHERNWADNGGRTPGAVQGERREDESWFAGMADGIRTGIHETDSDSLRNSLEGRSILQIRGGAYYRHLLRELLECAPLGRIGPMNPEWIEWLMGYPTGGTESNH